ncbi:MAG: hypothetical protein KF886_11805 [Candidatus Hydrogenedentes bacterium]|nr:hypothetical protein [Candidatus Hydrogenedentota bacterium]
MIIINLLPEELRPIKRTPLPHLLSVVALLLALASMGWMFVSITARIAGTRADLAKANSELAGLKDVVEEYNALSAKKEQLENKINVIQEILSDRIIWSAQLHKLSTLTPNNFWYRRIRETSKTVTMERVQIDEKTGQAVLDKDGRQKLIRENIRRPMLEVSGYVINDEQGVNSVATLTQKTAEDPDFSSMFILDSPQITDSEYNGYSVRGFTLEYRIDTGGAP